MFKIRKNVFETNSSSTHTICICRDPISEDAKNKVLDIDTTAEFGWEQSKADPVDYLYAMAKCFGRVDELLDMFEDLNLHVIYDGEETTPGIPDPEDDEYWDAPIDQYGDFYDLFDDLMSDSDFFLRFLFGKTVIYTGNDNSHDSRVDENWQYPEQKLDNYATYYKGN